MQAPFKLQNHTLTRSQPYLKLNCSLGEGPFWEEETNSVRFLDVEKCEFHRIDLNAGPSSHKVFKKLDISVGCTADIEGNDKEFIFGGKYGFGVANKETGDYRWVKKVWSDDEIKANKHEKFRGNDGAVDSQGRFWSGFMFDPLVEEMRSDGEFTFLPGTHTHVSLTLPRRRLPPEPRHDPRSTAEQHLYSQRYDLE